MYLAFNYFALLCLKRFKDFNVINYFNNDNDKNADGKHGFFPC